MGFLDVVGFFYLSWCAKKVLTDELRFCIFTEGVISMKALCFLFIASFIACGALVGDVEAKEAPDVQLYLRNGNVVTGELIETTPVLIILRIGQEVFTFDAQQVERIVTLESLGDEAEVVPVWRFPRLGFLGGSLAGAVVALWAFDSASSKEADADQNEKANIPGMAKKLRDEARRNRLIGWGAVLGASTCTVIALIPERGEQRMFPAQMEVGQKAFKLFYVMRF